MDNQRLDDSNSPKVSVIMGIYNCEDTLSAAIESILLQSYTNWELIMCDDASTDNTYLVADAYREQFPDKIILIKNETNSYLAYSLNHCLQYATGEYIARMDADDVSLPERFERQVAYLNGHPDMAVVGCTVYRFGDSGVADIFHVAEYPDRFTLRTKSPFLHATIMMRKSVYDALGGYTVSDLTRRSQDRDMWFRFYKMGYNGYNIQEPLFLGSDNAAAVKRRTFKVRLNSYKITRNGFKLLNYPRHWLIKPTIALIIKSIVPQKLIYLRRERLKMKSNAAKDL